MGRNKTGRRSFLTSAMAASAFVLANGGFNPRHFAAEGGPKRRFSPVRVSRDRLIRTVVGLRPYRSEGFVIKAERMGEKLLIHNYGHGGAGVTLSWGAATLSKALFGDAALIPVRGQMEVLLPQPEVDYCYLSDSFYMFPRRDGIILGGTFEHRNWSLEPDADQAARILEANSNISKGLRR